MESVRWVGGSVVGGSVVGCFNKPSMTAGKAPRVAINFYNNSVFQLSQRIKNIN